MKHLHLILILILTLTTVGIAPLWAFLAPCDKQDGVEVSIEGFEENSTRERFSATKIPTDVPLAYSVTIVNSRAENIFGKLESWLNDDWHVNDANSMTLAVPAGQKATIKFSATARPSVLPAIYPIHAKYTVQLGGKELIVHPIAIFEALVDTPATHKATPKTVLQRGIQRLDSDLDYTTFYALKDSPQLPLGVNYSSSDPSSGTHSSKGSVVRGGVNRSGFLVHPPWRKGAGTTWMDFKLQLPPIKPIALKFHTAIRDSTAHEGHSDGTEHKVVVTTQDGQSQELFTRFSDSTTWLPASVALDAFAGQEITLRLWTGPGPHNNTACDQCYWGDPLIVIGSLPTLLSSSERQDLEQEAIKKAIAATTQKSDSSNGTFKLDVRGEPFGAAVVLGKQGLTDGVIAFSDGTRHLVYHGFEVDVDNSPVGGVEYGQPVLEVTTACAGRGTLIVTHKVATRTGEIPLRATITTRAGALQLSWDMPDIERNSRGTPYYTRLGLGSIADQQLWRAYAGFGNCYEHPGPFELGAGGFSLSTRHVGADYDNGLSLVQACDIFPDRLIYAPTTRHFALQTHHDATFYLIPSARGAFAAARAYSDISGFKRSGGMKMLAGRMCVDQWGGDYAQAAHGLREAGRYGVNDAIFVKHSWQRWGYDYRLPEIYPPHGNLDDFLDMRQATRQAGMLFSPHDNYIDFYPDAADYSYDHIVFRANGQPMRAWYNRGRRAQSYRWLPHAFHPWMNANMRLMRDNFSPEALFIDVFTAIAPFDYYDRSGTFYPKMRTQQEWCKAFESCRSILKRGGVMISEAGTDALIGSVDAVQSDHLEPIRWIQEFSAAERVPWHDMATHTKMVLFAGGLGHRYSALNWEQSGRPDHGYGSDDYLSHTVIGGRNPMCDGPFSRRTVMTYWLLHDLCADLAAQTLESHRFGTSIHQQHTTFGNGGKVWVNRGSNLVWRVKSQESSLPHDVSLPQYGFIATTPRAQAGIILLDGQRAAFAQTANTLFVDARPPFDPLGAAAVASSTSSGRYLGNGQFEVAFDWEVLQPKLLQGHVAFLHLCHDKVGEGLEKIAFQANANLKAADLAQIGKFQKSVRFQFPTHLPAGTYQVRYGLYHPKTGRRIPIRGLNDGAHRIKGGTLQVAKRDNSFTDGSFTVERDHHTQNPTINWSGKMLNFGAATTDGAFRLLHTAKRSWRLIPLPGSRHFKVELELAAFGRTKAQVKEIKLVEPLQPPADQPRWHQDGTTLKIECDARAFAYDILF